MHHALIEVESTLTDRYQTTVPETVRKALHLRKKDKIHYIIQENGMVIITRAENKQPDPAIEAFLEFLAKDIQAAPHNIMPLNSELQQRAQSLVSGMDIDFNKPLLDEDE